MFPPSVTVMQHGYLLLVLLCCTICWQSTMAVEQGCPHSIAEASAAVAAAGPDEWVAERAAVAGRVPVVIMHWTMQDCAHCLALPPFLLLAIQTVVSAGNHVGSGSSATFCMFIREKGGFK